MSVLEWLEHYMNETLLIHSLHSVEKKMQKEKQQQFEVLLSEIAIAKVNLSGYWMSVSMKGDQLLTNNKITTWL